MSYQTRVSTKKSSFIPTRKFSPPPVLQPKAEIKPDAKLPEWKPGGGGATNPVQRLLDSKAVQTKLNIGQPEDAYEQETDRVASQVMSISTPADSSASVQRQLETNHPQQTWQEAQSITPMVQTQIDSTVQRRQMLQQADKIEGNQASGDLENRLNTSKGGGSPLSEGVRKFMEPRFGADFSEVRVHTSGEAVQMNQELGAQAFTHGSDVYFGEGKSPGNNELTAHELTHVVQQTGTSQIQTKEEDRSNNNLDYEAIAEQIHKGIAGLGTDEEAVHNALKKLENNPQAIKKLKQIYQSKYNESLEKAIKGDFSGEDLDIANELLVYNIESAQAQLKKLEKKLAWEMSKAAIDVAGIVDPTPISDGISATMGLADGDLIGAGLSLISMVPYVGDLLGKSAKGAKLTRKIVKLKQKIERLIKLIQKFSKKIPTKIPKQSAKLNIPSKKIDQLEIDPARYKKLRNKTPSNKIRDKINDTPHKIDPAYGEKVNKLEADHIISMKKITQMKGFNKLTEQQQLKVLNNPKNFVGLSKSSNASKGSKTFSEWIGHSKKGLINQKFKKTMIKKEKQLKTTLQNQINNLVKYNKPD